MFAGNDVIAISSLGGASGNFWLGILKGRPRLYIHVQWHFLSILNGLDVIQLFVFGWNISTGAKIWGFVVKITQNVKWEKNTCWEGTSLRQTASFEPFCVKLSLSVWPVQVRKKQKRQWSRKAGRKKSHKKCIFHVCVERLLAGGFQPNLAYLFVSRT